MELLNKFVLLEKIEEQSQPHTIELSDNDKFERSNAVVVERSNECELVDIGDEVVIYKHSSIDVSINTQEFDIVDENNILCIIKSNGDFVMTGDRVMIKQHEPKTHVGKILIAETDNSFRTSGIVVSTSKTIKNMKNGDSVMYQVMSGVSITIDEKKYKVFDKKEILLII